MERYRRDRAYVTLRSNDEIIVSTPLTRATVKARNIGAIHEAVFSLLGQETCVGPLLSTCSVESAASIRKYLRAMVESGALVQVGEEQQVELSSDTSRSVDRIEEGNQEDGDEGVSFVDEGAKGDPPMLGEMRPIPSPQIIEECELRDALLESAQSPVHSRTIVIRKAPEGNIKDRLVQDYVEWLDLARSETRQVKDAFSVYHADPRLPGLRRLFSCAKDAPWPRAMLVEQLGIIRPCDCEQVPLIFARGQVPGNDPGPVMCGLRYDEEFVDCLVASAFGELPEVCLQGCWPRDPNQGNRMARAFSTDLDSAGTLLWEKTLESTDSITESTPCDLLTEYSDDQDIRYLQSTIRRNFNSLVGVRTESSRGLVSYLASGQRWSSIVPLKALRDALLSIAAHVLSKTRLGMVYNGMYSSFHRYATADQLEQYRKAVVASPEGSEAERVFLHVRPFFGMQAWHGTAQL